MYGFIFFDLKTGIQIRKYNILLELLVFLCYIQTNSTIVPEDPKTESSGRLCRRESRIWLKKWIFRL